MTERSNRFQRLDGVLDVDALRERNVVVAGLGSGGSTVALELAKAGVERFTLIDPDSLEESNLIRHECDDRYLGHNKAEAVADLIRHRNPRADVEALAADVFDLGERLEEAVAGAALVVPCTDAEPPKHLLNRLCIAAGVPAVYAGVYEKAVGGEVIRCGGGPDDPCYACVTSALKDAAPVPGDAEELDYGAIGADGTLHGAPGLGLDVRLIALLHAKRCVLELLGEGGSEPDVILFGTAPVEGLFARRFANNFVNVAPQDGCLVCAAVRA
jgi:molybdopterin/thiamine biosynthesis adenylyltransferase